MLLSPSYSSRCGAGLVLVITMGLGLSSCATGSPNDTASPPAPSDGGYAGGDGGTESSTGGTGNTGGNSGSAGQGGQAGSGGAAGTGGSTITDTQCGSCSDSQECDDGFTCVTSPEGHPFCAADCGSDDCPAGDYECVDLSSYDSESGATGDGCVPTNGASCACTSAIEGHTRPCFNTNADGTCEGRETCTSGAWGSCDAPEADEEICDGIDNNCNGFTDMDEPGLTGNDLCAGGTAPPHGSFACIGGSCDLGDCESGWARYPANLPVTAGCACAVDDGDVDPSSNETCADAWDLGAIADEGASPLLIEGTLHSDTDVDWYTFQTTDVDQGTSFNSYRVHIEFLEPDGNPGNEYLFDVIRSADADPCAGEKASLTSYDWCADNSTTPATDDQSAGYRLKVYRADGVTGTCNAYKIRVTNGGSGTCPAADACGAD